MSEQPEQGAVPYVSYVTAKNFIDGLSEHPLPTKINRSLMSNLAYSVQPQLLAALRYLDLITADGTPTDKLAQLVQAKDKPRAQLMAKIVKEAYGFLFSGGFDLSRTTPGELDERFKSEGGVGGSTVGKAVSFFIAAAKDVGITLSPHLAKRKVTTAPNPGRKRKAKRVNGEAHDEPPPPPPPPGAPQDLTQALLAKFPSFDPEWNDSLKAAWFKGYADLLARTNKPARKGKAEE